MLIIADSGSTKTTWSVTYPGGNNEVFATEGLNPYYMDETYIVNAIKQGMGTGIVFDEVKQIFFYGAGCDGDKKQVLASALSSLFVNSAVEVDSDMMAAARSLVGNGSGLVCILGTGMNSCLIEDGKISHQVNSLGFLMGDEGSGAYLGKRLLVLYARYALSQEVMDLFFQEYQIMPDDVLDLFYAQKLPNRFSASFTVFLSKYIEHACIYDIVKSGFSDFFVNIISRYPNYKQFRINCVGSIAFVFHEVLEEVAREFGMTSGKISKSPMEDLYKFHL